MAIFWGFAGLGVATLMAAIMNPHGGPMPLSHPVRIVGNMSGLAFMAGLFFAAYRRYTDVDLKRTSIFADHFFLWLMIFVGATGFAAEFAADFELFVMTAVFYYTHLVGVAILLTMAPFTKFVHSIGRPLILLIERRRRIVA
jgi:quinone-modifying oxidoreductase subunit QmoC